MAIAHGIVISSALEFTNNTHSWSPRAATEFEQDIEYIQPVYDKQDTWQSQQGHTSLMIVLKGDHEQYMFSNAINNCRYLFSKCIAG